MKELRLFYTFMVVHDHWDEYKVARREGRGGSYPLTLYSPEEFLSSAFSWASSEGGAWKWSEVSTSWDWVLWGFRQAQS